MINLQYVVPIKSLAVVAEASKSRGSNSNASGSQAGRVNQDSTTEGKKREQSRRWTTALEILQMPVILALGKKLHSHNKNGILPLHLEFSK